MTTHRLIINLRFIICNLLIFLFFHTGIVYAANNTDSNKCSGVFCKKNSIELQLFGFGTPVGTIGILFNYYLKPSWDIETGFGLGMTGKHLTANIRYHFKPKSKYLSFYGLFGTSYSLGEAAKRESQDYDQDGKIGFSSQTPDALWLNIAVGTIFYFSNKVRVTLEAGLAYPIITEINRKAKSATENRMVCDNLCGMASTPMLSPSISLIRIGYLF